MGSTEASAILTRRLTKSYGTTVGIRNVDLDVRRGEIFGFIGPNGAGKSTTIRLLMQLMRPTSGEMYLFGQRLTGDDPALRRRIGYLPSEVSYYNDLTGRQLLEFVTGIYGKPLRRPVEELADALALDLSKRVKTYSLGNRKKLGIVQALVHEPELLVLDEPTSGLDPLVKATFFDMLRERRRRGATIFFSTHVLTDVEELCDRVGLIRDGSVFQVGGVEDIPGRKRRTLVVKFADPGNFIEALNLRAVDPDVTYDGDVHRIRVEGEINEALRRIAGRPVVDLTVERPSLEEIVLHLYQVGGAPPEHGVPSPPPAESQNGGQTGRDADGEGGGGR